MAYVAKINGYDIKDAEARADLADEITARQSADTALGGRIDDETSARQSADTALGGRIDDETSARQSADTALGGRIDDETSARQSADTALGGKIGDLSELTTTATADLVAAINEVDSHADSNASDIAVIVGNDTGKSMREVAQEVSATVYTPQGSCTFANLPSLSASSTRVGFVYDVIDAFTTTGDFKEGAGIEVPAGTNIVVADVSGTKMWDLLGFNIDLSPYQKKQMTTPVIVGGVSQSTVERAIGALAELPVDTVADGNMNPVTSNAVYDAMNAFDHNIPRWVNGKLGKDITSYVSDGSIWKRLNGTDGFSLFEDIYVGDYFQMSRAITCPDSTDGTAGSDWVTIAGINTLKGNGDTVDMMQNHLVMMPGKGEEGFQHFGRHAMNSTDTTAGGYKASVMRTSVLGAVVSAGSTASGATINQQLYAEFGSHLKTTRELITNDLNANGVNRFGSASGCSSGWEWSSEQAILMSEVEVYGSIVWSSSGFDTGLGKTRLPLFAHSTKALNNCSAYWWLKDMASASFFCFVSGRGFASYSYAGSSDSFVRPRFVLAA